MVTFTYSKACIKIVVVQLMLTQLADAGNPCSRKITIKSYKIKVFLCQMGLKQGCNLSPLLANIYQADLHNILDENNQHGPILVDSSVINISWADHLMILSLDKKSSQNSIHSLQAYSDIWKLEVSLKKPSVLFFHSCQVSRIGRETHGFSNSLTVSRSMDEISQILANLTNFSLSTINPDNLCNF